MFVSLGNPPHRKVEHLISCQQSGHPMARRTPQIARTNADGTGKFKGFSPILEGKGGFSQPNLTTTTSLSLFHELAPVPQADTPAAAPLRIPLIVWIISALVAVVAYLWTYPVSKHMEPVGHFFIGLTYSEIREADR